MMPELSFSQTEQTYSTRYSKAGYAFNLNEDVWVLDKNRTINWRLVNQEIDKVVYEGFKLTIARLAEEVSSHHTFNCWNYTKTYLLSSDMYQEGLITSKLILSLKAILNQENEYKLGTIRALLRCWLEWDFKGLEKGLENTLDRLILSGNIKGKAVLQNCPYTGPYTLTEQQFLLVWAGNAFNTGKLTLEEFAWFYTIYATARRPTQILALRICDLTIQNSLDGMKYELNIPRAKQRGGIFRGEMRSLIITEDMYLILMNLINEVKIKVKRYLPDIESEDLNQIPIFLNNKNLNSVNSVEDLRDKLKTIPDFLHGGASKHSSLSNSVSKKCEAISERTGEYIHFTPIRCRRTRATNLVRHGITGVQLAYLMDHSDTQQLKVYTAYTAELAARIFDKMKDAMAFLAAQFEGRLIENENEALRGNDPNSRVYKSNNEHIGNCGDSPSCQAGIKACLLCNKFQPLLHAPWDELFLELLEEMEQREKDGASELILKSFDLQLAHVKAILDACDKRITMEEIA